MESLDKSLRRAMAHAEIPPQMQYRLMNAFAKVRQLSAEDRMADQLIMLSECLKSARSSARAPGATPAKAEVYNLYAKLLEKTRAEITSALRGTPENPEPTLQEIRKARTELNHARADRDHVPGQRPAKHAPIATRHSLHWVSAPPYGPRGYPRTSGTSTPKHCATCRRTPRWQARVRAAAP